MSNVVLDVFLKRDEFLRDSAAVFLANHEDRLTGHLSAAIAGKARLEPGLPPVIIPTNKPVCLETPGVEIP